MTTTITYTFISLFFHLNLFRKERILQRTTSNKDLLAQKKRTDTAVHEKKS